MGDNISLLKEKSRPERKGSTIKLDNKISVDKNQSHLEIKNQATRALSFIFTQGAIAPCYYQPLWGREPP